MPIAPLYEWTESEKALEVRVQLQGASKSKPDVFATDCLIKVNSPPYLLILDLFGFVDESQSVVTLTPEGVIFRLTKQGSGTWGQLEASAGADKDELLARRNASVDRAHARLEAARLLRLERKQKEEKEAVDRQIEVDRKRRAEIEARKKQELQTERDKLAEWQKGIGGGPGSGNGQSAGLGVSYAGDADAESDYEDEEEGEGEGRVRQGQNGKSAGDGESEQQAMVDHPDYHGRGWQGSHASGKPKARPTAKVLDEDNDDDSEDDQRARSRPEGTSAGADDSEEEPVVGSQAGAVSFRPLPPPRIRLQPVQVEFTKLETGHLPAREHREEEIRVYKKSLRDSGQLADSADVADRQPVFLKDKGDALYKQGNFRGAFNAYSRALELDPEGANPALFSNRAACAMQLGEHTHCEADCSRALEILHARQARVEAGPAAEAGVFRKQLVKALARRGQARAALGQMAEAEADYVEALRYDASNAALASDLEELRAAMGPADAATLRQRGTARFQAKDYEGAVEAFSLLLGMHAASVPEADRLAALSNRAACMLVLERYEEAVQDCTAALEVHVTAVQGARQQQQQGQTQGPGGEGEVGSSTASVGPLKCGSAEQLHQWVEGLQTWPLEAGQAAAACKAAARRGAALAHLRRYADSALDYVAAAALAGWAGDAARREQLEEDAARVRGLAAEAGQGQGRAL